jgi:benzoylformate decarboxylase
VLYVILANGGYAIMDRLAERHGGDAPWPGFGDLELASVARAFGCEARRIETHDDLLAALDEVLPTLASRETPLLLDVVIAPTAHFAP